MACCGGSKKKAQVQEPTGTLTGAALIAWRNARLGFPQKIIVPQGLNRQASTIFSIGTSIPPLAAAA